MDEFLVQIFIYLRVYIGQRRSRKGQTFPSFREILAAVDSHSGAAEVRTRCEHNTHYGAT